MIENYSRNHDSGRKRIMCLRKIVNLCIAASLLALGTNFILQNAAFAARLLDAGDGEQMLTRGPVHEAFAEPVTYSPAAGIVVPKAPPAAIEELPPDQKPTRHECHVDFRLCGPGRRAKRLPLGQRHLARSCRPWPAVDAWLLEQECTRPSNGTSGYWADAQVSHVQYLPEPSGVSVEAGPNIAATSPDCYLAAGQLDVGAGAPCPGVLVSGPAAQANWDWVPAHYVWCPLRLRGSLMATGITR